MPTEAIPAATVVMLRDSPCGPEVLLVRRRQGSGSFSGASVFPGGVVDSGDSEPDLVPPQSGFVPDLARAAVGNSFGPDTLRALHVAACRELFEEAGILFARDDAGRPAAPALVSALAAERSKLQNGTVSLGSLLRSARLVLALGQLQPLAHWITPEHQPRRWDTLFFLTNAPPGQCERADGSETSEALWLRPSEALAAYARGEHLLAPPTFRVLEDLASCDTITEILSRARAAGPPPVILPVPLNRGPDPTLVFPGDREYPGTQSTIQNRIVLRDGRWHSIREP